MCFFYLTLQLNYYVLKAGHLRKGASKVIIGDPDGTFTKFRQPAEKEPADAEERVDYLSINVSDVPCSKRFSEMFGFQSQGAPVDDNTESVDDPLAAALGLGSKVIRITEYMSHRVDVRR